MTFSACHFVIRHVYCFYVCESRNQKVKAAIEREQSEVRFDSAEFEQARPKVKALRTYVKLKV